MKARVKATGEVLDVETRYVSDNSIQIFEEKELEFETPKLTEQDTAPCDLWEERRYELAKDLLPSFAIAVKTYTTATGGTVMSFLLSKEEVAKNVVEYADALINELKKQGDE